MMEKSFYTGKGVGVCILDTGIYEHIDFAGRIWAFYDFLSFKRRPYDDNGHGTHVAGLAAGDGTASMGKYRGAAPGCGIIALKPGGRAACHPLDPGVPAAVPNSGGKHFRWHHLQFQKGSCTACGKRGAALG